MFLPECFPFVVLIEARLIVTRNLCVGLFTALIHSLFSAPAVAAAHKKKSAAIVALYITLWILKLVTSIH
jgi:hypothetical protein